MYIWGGLARKPGAEGVLLLVGAGWAESVRWRGRDKSSVALFAGGEGSGDEGDNLSGIGGSGAEGIIRADVDADGVAGAAGAVVIQGDVVAVDVQVEGGFGADLGADATGDAAFGGEAVELRGEAEDLVGLVEALVVGSSGVHGEVSAEGEEGTSGNGWLGNRWGVAGGAGPAGGWGEVEAVGVDGGGAYRQELGGVAKIEKGDDVAGVAGVGIRGEDERGRLVLDPGEEAPAGATVHRGTIGRR